MKKITDWGAWISLAAVLAVGVAVMLRLAPASPAIAAEKTEKPQRAEKREAAEKLEGAEKLQGAEKADPDAKGGQGEKPATDERDQSATLAMVSGVPAKPEVGPSPKPTAPGRAGYRLNHPDATHVLARSLDEISGLSASSEPDNLWAIHDERSTLFRISATDGSVLHEINFGKHGDYEAVEEVGDRVYIARSDGVLVVVDPKGGVPTRLNFETRLGLDCDLEGMAHEAQKKRLLLSCKNESRKSSKTNKAFEIYAMGLDSKELAKDPVYVLTEEQIDAYLAAHPEREEFKRLKGKSFAPSGLAVHPRTGEIYVASTRGNMVVVLDPKGALVRVDWLDPAVHPQPEGIAFRPDGTLFISSEAHGKRALLHVFKFHPEGKE